MHLKRLLWKQNLLSWQNLLRRSPRSRMQKMLHLRRWKRLMQCCPGRPSSCSLTKEQSQSRTFRHRFSLMKKSRNEPRQLPPFSPYPCRFLLFAHRSCPYCRRTPGCPHRKTRMSLPAPTHSAHLQVPSLPQKIQCSLACLHSAAPRFRPQRL